MRTPEEMLKLIIDVAKKMNVFEQCLWEVAAKLEFIYAESKEKSIEVI